MKKLFFALCIIAIAIQANAQDKHFSQFYSSPLTLNPALTGLMDGRYRAAISYRNQWGSIMDEPFVTTGATFDGRFSLFKKQKHSDQLGAGLTFFSDKGPIHTNQIMISGAYHKVLDPQGKSTLSAGYQIGISQVGFNFQDYTFNDEFDGTTGYSLPTNENFNTTNISHADMATGIFWTFSPKRTTNVYVGAALNHFNRANISFNKDHQDDPQVYRQLMRITGHAGAQFRLNRGVVLEPRAVVLAQGGHFEVNAGANLRLLVSDFSGSNLYLGAWVRPVGDVDGSVQLDAAVFSAALQVANVQVGASYDVNLSSLSIATSGRGAFELSLIFLGNYENDSVVCPTF